MTEKVFKSTQTLKRTALLWAVALFLGIAVNQLAPEGIRWQLLLLRGNTAVNIVFVSADSAFVLFAEGRAKFIDVRPREEFDIDHIPGAISLPLLEYLHQPDYLQRFDPQTTYIFYCFDPECEDTGALAREFGVNGFRNVLILYGGFSAWLERGYPVEE